MSCSRAREVDLAAFSVAREGAEWADFRDHYPRCAECSREVARWARLAAVLQNPGPEAGRGHPAEEHLLAYQTEPADLEPAQRTAIEDHLAGCGACRSELAVLGGFDFGPLQRPERAPAEAPSTGSRIVGPLSSLAEILFGAVPRPALAFTMLLVLVVPAGLLMWRFLTHGGVGEPGGAPIAQVQDSAPEARFEKPGRTSPGLQVAGNPPESSTVEDPVAPGAVQDALEARRIALEEELETQPVEPDLDPLTEAIAAIEEPTSQSLALPSPPERETEAEPSIESPEHRSLQIAALIPSSTPLYQADPLLAGGSLETIRAGTLIRAGAGTLPGVRALGPEHVGATTEPSPTLYWFLDGSSDVSVEITLGDTDAVEPHLELRVEPPIRAGLHALRLAEHAVRLAPGVVYDWFVTLVPDPERRDTDVISGAAIRRTPAGDALASRLESAGPAEKAHVLAAFGYWYDAFDVLSGWIEAEPDASVLRRHRAALLEQVGLLRAAQELGTDGVR